MYFYMARPKSESSNQLLVPVFKCMLVHLITSTLFPHLSSFMLL